jgi:hypothetical protein
MNFTSRLQHIRPGKYYARKYNELPKMQWASCLFPFIFDNDTAS